MMVMEVRAIQGECRGEERRRGGFEVAEVMADDTQHSDARAAIVFRRSRSRGSQSSTPRPRSAPFYSMLASGLHTFHQEGLEKYVCAFPARVMSKKSMTSNVMKNTPNDWGHHDVNFCTRRMRIPTCSSFFDGGKARFGNPEPAIATHYFPQLHAPKRHLITLLCSPSHSSNGVRGSLFCTWTLTSIWTHTL